MAAQAHGRALRLLMPKWFCKTVKQIVAHGKLKILFVCFVSLKGLLHFNSPKSTVQTHKKWNQPFFLWPSFLEKRWSSACCWRTRIHKPLFCDFKLQFTELYFFMNMKKVAMDVALISTLPLIVCVCARWLSHVRLFEIPWITAHQVSLSVEFSMEISSIPGNNTGASCYFVLQGIFPTQGSNPPLLGLLHWPVGSLPLALPGKPFPLIEGEVTQLCLTLCDLMDCSLPGSSIHGIFQARILDWVTISFSRRSSQPRFWTGVSHIIGRRFTIWATTEVPLIKFL